MHSGRLGSPQVNDSLPLGFAASCSGIMAAIISVSPSDSLERATKLKSKLKIVSARLLATRPPAASFAFSNEPDCSKLKAVRHAQVVVAAFVKTVCVSLQSRFAALAMFAVLARLTSIKFAVIETSYASVEIA